MSSRNTGRPGRGAPLVRLAPVASAALLAAQLAACGPHQPPALATTAEDGRTVSLDSATSAFDVGGVRVIHRANFATDVVAANLYLLGGARQLTPATQGIESLLLHASEYGTARHPGEATRAAWARTGSSLVIDPEADWTLYGFRGIREEFDASWDVFTERLMHPTLAPRDVAAARSRLSGRIRIRRTSPDGLAFLLADSVAYAGHPYALRPEGTEASLASLDSAALARYAAEQLVQSRLLLVVVGSIDRATVESAVSRTLGRLPRGDYRWSLPAVAPVEGPRATMVPRAQATNYVLGVFHGPPASSPDAPAFRLATALLSSRVNHWVREERGLSYAAYAFHNDRGMTDAGVYVSTGQPALALQIVKAQIDTMRNQTYPLQAMRFFAQSFATSYFGENMTSADQADFLARALLFQGDHQRAADAMGALRGVSGSDVRAAVWKYFKAPRFVFVGDTTRLPRAEYEKF